MRLDQLASTSLRLWARGLSRRCVRSLTTTNIDLPTATTTQASRSEPTRIHWHSVPLDKGGGGEGIPLPQRPSDLTVRRVWSILREVRASGAAPLHTFALSILAQEARQALALEITPTVEQTTRSIDATATALPDSATQLLFDLRYLNAALAAAAEAPNTTTTTTTSDGTTSLDQLEAELSRLSKRVDPISHTLADKPLGRAVRSSVESLSTLLNPLSVTSSSTPATSATAAATSAPPPPQPQQAGSGDGGGMLRLPPPCARFSLLPVQTPPLHSKRLLGREGASGERPGGSAGSSAAGSDAAKGDAADGEGAGGSIFARVGGVLSSATRGGLKESVLDGLASTSAAAKATALGDKLLGGRWQGRSWEERAFSAVGPLDSA